ncbi:MAG: hypothetical protein HRT71_17870 [Flavobacteriales bacterium]|nr:hypothetical protein [Flavobacteriales bacterium]
MKRILLSAFAICIAVSSMAQTIQIDGVKGRKFKGVKSIRDGKGETISGYYTYYEVDKGEKGMRQFEFAIVDKGVTKVVNAQIALHKSAQINNTVFNGKFFLISFDDRKNKKIVFNILDLNGKIVKTRETPVEKKKNASSVVYPAENGAGFYVVQPIWEKGKHGYSLSKIDNQLAEVWRIEEVVPKGAQQIADLVNSEGKLVTWKEHGMGWKKLKPSILGYDANTGKNLFQYDGYDGTSTIMYNQIRISEDGSILAGGAYVDGEKYKTGNNTGIYMLKLNAAGKKELYTKVSNKEQIQEFLKTSSEGISLGKDKIFVEDLIIDGNDFVIVSEMFRKKPNISPYPAQKIRDLLTGKWVGDMSRTSDGKAPPKSTFEVMDFMLFKFNNKGELGEMKCIKKEEYNRITLYPPYHKYRGVTLAKEMAKLGWFDYDFCTTGKNGERIMVCKNNSEARKPQVFTYTMSGSYAQTKVNLKQEGKINLEEGKVTTFKVLRNSPGKIGVAYYQRKLKRITLNIETLF